MAYHWMMSCGFNRFNQQLMLQEFKKIPWIFQILVANPRTCDTFDAAFTSTLEGGRGSLN
jgi:hypothetical protein